MLSDSFINFMLVYMHAASVATLALSILVFYLMLKRTPRSGRIMVRHLMLVQFFVLLNDFILGVLVSGVPLFPAPAGFCEGILCVLGVPGHVGMTLMFFSLAYVATSIVFCFHVKYTTVVDLLKHRTIT
ncbi:hypothetical protein PFISCL1PPCAC_13580, partial [Pristionchus fissidentatus]